MMKRNVVGQGALTASLDAARVATQESYVRDQAETRRRLKQARVLAGPDVNDGLKRHERDTALQHRALKDSGYIAVQGEPFVRRANPKVRGKAARKAHKKARHAQRNRIGNAT